MLSDLISSAAGTESGPETYLFLNKFILLGFITMN